MEHVVDKAVILAGAIACLSLNGAPAPATVAATLLIASSALFFDVVPHPMRPVLVVCCGLIPLVVPDAIPALALPVYDGATLLYASDSETERLGVLARYAGIVPLAAFCVDFMLGRMPPASSGVTVCLIACAGLLSLRTGSALTRRKRAQTSRDEFTAQAIALGRRNRQLEREVQEARQRDETARIDVPPEFSQLTPREMEVARLVSEGLDNREIATRAFMGEGTVRNIISSILTKLGLKNRTQIAVLYWKARSRM